MAFDFSLVNDKFTPIKPAKVEQLFSPNVKSSPARIINDLTYRIPAIPKTPTTRKFANTSLESPPGIRAHFPRQSTGLKDQLQQPLCSTVKYVNESISSGKDLLLNETGDQDPNQAQQFQPYQQLQDTLPIRATCFHPSGDVYAIGSNSKTLRLCAYPSQKDQENFTPDDSSCKPDVVYSSVGLHRGSVYCIAFNHGGTLLATGSNDQMLHVIKYNAQKHMPTGSEYALDFHKGKVRDVCFLDNGESSCLLASAGSGDNSICLTDCKVMKRVHTLAGHKDCVMSLYCWTNDSTTFVSGGLDGAIKFWDTRTQRCIANVNSNKQTINDKGSGDKSQSGNSPVGVVRVDPSGRLLVSGHEDGKCMLYDIRGGRQIQSFKAHESELRTLNFSPKSYYLLSAGYDGNIKLMDLQGDLTRKLPSVDIAKLSDKIIQTAWHPDDYTFVTTSADGLATLWMMPDSSNNSQVINN